MPGSLALHGLRAVFVQPRSRYPGGPMRTTATACLLAALTLALAGAAQARPKRAKAQHGVPFPPGSRILEDGIVQSSRGFRKTVRYYQKYLKRAGIPHRAVPVYRRGDTTVARFLATKPGPWLAIHIYMQRGRTRITIVATPAPQSGQPP